MAAERGARTAKSASGRGRDGTLTRRLLMDTAERLFATHGVDAVSLNEIVQSAKVNTAAVHYHFRSKEGLVAAILARGTAEWAVAREVMLDELESRARPRLRDAVAAMVVPTARLCDTEPGRNYVRFLDAVASHPEYSKLLVAATDQHTSRMLSELERVTPKLPSHVRLLRFALARDFILHALADADGPVRLWMESHGADEDRPFTEDLIDFVAGALGAPVSH